MSKYAVMLFHTEMELGKGNTPGNWINTQNFITDDPKKALFLYSEIPCPASQLIKAEDDYELKCKMGEMILNFMDEEWLNKELYPTL